MLMSLYYNFVYKRCVFMRTISSVGGAVPAQEEPRAGTQQKYRCTRQTGHIVHEKEHT